MLDNLTEDDPKEMLKAANAPAKSPWPEGSEGYKRMVKAAPSLLRDLRRLVEMHDIPDSEWDGEFDRLALTGRLGSARATLAYVYDDEPETQDETDGHD